MRISTLPKTSKIIIHGIIETIKSNKYEFYLPNSSTYCHVVDIMKCKKVIPYSIRPYISFHKRIEHIYRIQVDLCYSVMNLVILWTFDPTHQQAKSRESSS